MMENFSHILQRLSITTGTSSSSDHFGGTSPFKVQVNFDIPVFEGQIDVDALEKWLNMLEGYFSVHNFSDREKITFTLLKALPHVKHWWETYWEKISTEESGIYGPSPLGIFLWMRSRNNITLLVTMMGIKDSERHLVLKYRGALHRYIQTEMDFWTSHHWELPIDMLSKSEKKFRHQNK
jgi:hypothetical protein